MTLDEALIIWDNISDPRHGFYDGSPSSVLKGGISPNDLHRAHAVIWEAWNTPGAPRSVRQELSHAMTDLSSTIDQMDPDGFRRGAERQLRMDAARAERAAAGSPPRAPARTPPGPPPETGMYDRLGRKLNPSFRQSRAFHGTLPQATEAALRHPYVGRGMSRPARQAVRSTAAKLLPGVGAGIDGLAAYNEGARDFDDWMAQEEETITGMVPGTVSPSELPPPAVLSPDRLRAVEATQGMVGVAPDTQTPNVTTQEVRTYVLNQYAKGEPLPDWARRISRVLPNGELAVNPVNPRAAETRSSVAKTWDVLD